jgi:hypothetical protein
MLLAHQADKNQQEAEQDDPLRLLRSDSFLFARSFVENPVISDDVVSIILKLRLNKTSGAITVSSQDLFLGLNFLIFQLIIDKM